MKPQPRSSKHSWREAGDFKFENYTLLRVNEVDLNNTAENYFEECDRKFYFQIIHLILYVYEYYLSVLKLPLNFFPQQTYSWKSQIYLYFRITFQYC
jgi:hypothetical protein